MFPIHQYVGQTPQCIGAAPRSNQILGAAMSLILLTCLEWPSLCQCIECLRELAYSRTIGPGKAFRVASARLANGNPPSLRIDEIGPLTHGNERRQDTKERGQASLVLAEHVAFADRQFGGS